MVKLAKGTQIKASLSYYPRKGVTDSLAQNFFTVYGPTKVRHSVIT